MPFALTPFRGGLLLTLVESVGDYALKRFATGGSPAFSALGFGVYGALAAILVWLFKTLGLAITNAYWDALSNVAGMAMGFFLLQESYTLRQWIGMILLTFGMVLVNGNH
jgi:multidrug transporter EmrE-like cation transporter